MGFDKLSPNGIALDLDFPSPCPVMLRAVAASTGRQEYLDSATTRGMTHDEFASAASAQKPQAKHLRAQFLAQGFIGGFQGGKIHRLIFCMGF